jgi:hypothetical protein
MIFSQVANFGHHPLMFFSLDQPVTKNQILNIKYEQKCFVEVVFLKEKKAGCLFFFPIVPIAKKLLLTFGI